MQWIATKQLANILWDSSGVGQQWFGIGLWSRRSWFDSQMVLFVIAVSLSKNFTHTAPVNPAGNSLLQPTQL